LRMSNKAKGTTQIPVGLDYDSSKFVTDSSVSVADTIFGPGIHPYIIYALNATLGLLLLVFLFFWFAVEGVSIHVYILLGILVGLFICINWFISEMSKQPIKKNSKKTFNRKNSKQRGE